MPGQWEFQIGYRGIDGEACDALTVADDVWIARYLLHRVGEQHGVRVSFDNKPVKGDWNGAGMHTNFSTAYTRDPHFGIDAIHAIVDTLSENHDEHIGDYGDKLIERLTGDHETCDINTFRSGVAHRGASIRIPQTVALSGYGYLEDRRTWCQRGSLIASDAALSDRLLAIGTSTAPASRNLVIVMLKLKRNLAAILAGLGLTPLALADTGINAEVGYLFNTLLLLVCGVLVMFMAAGFAMLEAGMVRSKSVAVILAKNITLYSVASVMFFLLGYQLMYGDSLAGIVGELGLWSPAESGNANFSSEQPSVASWFFQMVFVATAASVVSGALAERVKFWPFVIFVVVLTGILYPVVGHWTWGGGWLAGLGFTDFAGSTIVHSVGGWAALAGIILLGARRGRFDVDGKPVVLAPSSLPMVTLGTFILWLGWFGFNGGSQLAFSSAADAYAVATIFGNTNAAAAGGVIAAAIASQLVYRRLDLSMMLNGALAGLVSITAEPLAPTLGQAVLIGAIGGVFMMIGTRALENLQLDDVVGAIPVHLVAGIWGTLAVCITNPDADFQIQLIGIGAIGAFAFGLSYLLWTAMRFTTGIRLRSHHENEGGDLAEIGMRAYNLG